MDVAAGGDEIQRARRRGEEARTDRDEEQYERQDRRVAALPFEVVQREACERSG